MEMENCVENGKAKIAWKIVGKMAIFYQFAKISILSTIIYYVIFIM